MRVGLMLVYFSDSLRAVQRALEKVQVLLPRDSFSRQLFEQVWQT
jgi:hypothetical protein